MFGIVVCLLPFWASAVIITTEYKVGDEVYTNIDKARYATLHPEMQAKKVAPEDTWEARTVIKRYLEQNHLRFSQKEREDLYATHLQRLNTDAAQFEDYLKRNGLSRDVFVEELAYRQELLRWMTQAYGWREVVRPSELRVLKAQMKKDFEQHQKVSFELVKVSDRARLPKHYDESFWKAHAADLVVYRDVAYDRIPEAYEAFVRTHKAGDVSEPIEAFGSWHVLRLLAKQELNMPDDAVLTHYVLEQKCLKRVRAWVVEQLPWIYRKGQ